MKCNIVYFCIKLETYRFFRYRKDSVIIGSVDGICGAFLRTFMNLINMPRIDTRKRKSACKPPVVDLLLSMIEYVADYENSFRKIRQKEGIALAK